jgi:hypothetical protein
MGRRVSQCQKIQITLTPLQTSTERLWAKLFTTISDRKSLSAVKPPAPLYMPPWRDKIGEGEVNDSRKMAVVS